MEDHGFSYPATAAAPLPDPADDAAGEDLARRRKNGYGIASDSAAPAVPSSAVDKSYAELSAEERRGFDLTLFGPEDRKHVVNIPGGGRFTVPREGCEADSRRRLAGDVVLWTRITYTPEAVDNELANRADSAPEYLSAVRRWRACMTARGHSYDSPEAAYGSLQDRFATTGAASGFRRQEKDVAVADAECASASRLSSSALQARRRLAATLSKDVRMSLNELAAYRTALLARLDDVGED
ncbi:MULTISPECIES: hypothetical protein [Streptomyces]|uniref:Uncharacterized protein n=1 Tax=Streptomyces fimbriatus TaxID=68197 RepID=A0ABW0DJ62_STRFI